MRPSIFIIFFIFLFPLVQSQIVYDDYFTSGSMRIDYIMSGNDTAYDISVHDYYRDPFWGGNPDQLVYDFVRGDFYYTIQDKSAEVVIYKYGFNTLFAEWQTTQEAKRINRSFEGTLRFPYPKYPFILSIYQRDGYHDDRLVFQLEIDPNNFLIEQRDPENYEVRDIIISGASNKKADLVFMGDGYTKEEMGKYLEDVQRFTDFLFSQDPFTPGINKFNVRAVLVPSEDSGPDNPGLEIWNTTALHSSFYTFGSERYLMTKNYWKVADIASLVPYDHIIILVNTDKYGGGGIYNYYSLVTSDHELSEIVLVHELGHGFAGLGDEYYTSDVAYSDFYDLEREPVDPNLTTLVSFDVKWKHMLEEGIPVPTPDIPEYKKSVGVFEGGGYNPKGIYRPQTDCRMKSNDADNFCKVCQEAIIEIIDYYSK